MSNTKIFILTQVLDYSKNDNSAKLRWIPPEGCKKPEAYVSINSCPILRQKRKASCIVYVCTYVCADSQPFKVNSQSGCKRKDIAAKCDLAPSYLLGRLPAVSKKNCC